LLPENTFISGDFNFCDSPVNFFRQFSEFRAYGASTSRVRT
jgi:hypothetical protein